MEKNVLREKSNRRYFFGDFGKRLSSIAALSAILPLQKLQAARKLQVENSVDPDLWFNEIKGKHKIVYDAPTFHEGFSVIWSWTFLDSNNKTGSPDNDLTAMVVFRNTAFALALENRIWSHYKLGKFFKVLDPTSMAPAVRNPYWDPKEGEMPEKGMSIKALQERGVMFCVCEKAIGMNSVQIGKSRGVDPEEVKKDLMGAVLPGIQVVPSGVWAIGRAQEHGCAYCFAG